MKKMTVAVVAIASLGVLVFLLARNVESPEQLAARAEPPPAGPVLADVYEGFLADPVNFSVTAQRRTVSPVLPSPALSGVVTSVQRTVGEELRAGNILLRSNGQPVFVLPGQFQLYRDISAGDRGDDVVAIQNGLRAAGYGIGRDREGVYGAGTQSAVAAMYRDSGYQAPVVSADADAGATSSSDHQQSDETASTSSADPPATSQPDTTGPVVRMAEIVMVTSLPAVVESIVPIGVRIDESTPLVTLGSGETILTATVPVAAAATVAVGAAATFVDENGSAQTAVVSAVSTDAAGALSTITLDSTTFATVGAQYVVTIDNPSLETGSTLLVPSVAVVARAGFSYIYVHQQDGSFVETEVHVLGVRGGIASIADGDGVTAGAEVRIGQ